MLNTKCKKKHGLLLYTDEDEQKIVNYDVENDKFTIERCVKSPLGPQSILITSDELSLDFKRAMDKRDYCVESDKEETSESATIAFVDMALPEDIPAMRTTLYRLLKRAGRMMVIVQVRVRNPVAMIMMWRTT